MNLIQQLLGHFRSKGELSKEQLGYLEGLGFVRSSDDPPGAHDEYEEPWSACSIIPEVAWFEPEDLYEQDRRLEPVERARGPHRRSGRSARQRKTVGMAELAGRFSRVSSSWAEPLSGLVGLAARLGCCGTWEGAAAILASSSDREVEGALCGALRQSCPELTALWRAIAFDGVTAVLSGQNGRRPAVRVCHKIVIDALTGRSSSRATGLHRPAIARVQDLARSQGRLFRAFAALVPSRPELLGHALERGFANDTYWTLAVLHSVRPGRPGESDAVVWKVSPGGDAWRRVWEHALLADHLRVGRYLVRHCGSWSRGGPMEVKLLKPRCWPSGRSRSP